MNPVGALLTLAVALVRAASAQPIYGEESISSSTVATTSTSSVPDAAEPTSTGDIKQYAETFFKREHPMHNGDYARVPPMAACSILGVLVLAILCIVLYSRRRNSNSNAPALRYDRLSSKEDDL
ncbi:hypothetical protein H4S06_004890 [Coemansia sp. BCRC 34490]|nr:hypothetical protein LPJ72_005288 [Coemansia sp. Benny D160-2]KAJ2748648.1 hypothetical protein H4S06_004890 [Coemansia sp. BCRC 34490]